MPLWILQCSRSSRLDGSDSENRQRCCSAAVLAVATAIAVAAAAAAAAALAFAAATVQEYEDDLWEVEELQNEFRKDHRRDS